MGYVVHHAIVVTSWNYDRLRVARDKAFELLPGLVTEIIETRVNRDYSFFVGPDGSKEGWEESDEGDRQRDQFIAWLNTQRHEDHSTWLHWAEVAYSSDDRNAKVTRHAWERAPETEFERT